MKKLNETENIIKKSRFIGISYKIESDIEAKAIIEQLKKEHKKARHIAYCYKIDNIIKKTDDKEPANTAGTPIYNIIEKRNLNKILIVVIRYYGGIKLGAGGLIRAYGATANDLTKTSLE